jgi:hypothetical protein
VYGAISILLLTTYISVKRTASRYGDLLSRLAESLMAWFADQCQFRKHVGRCSQEDNDTKMGE